MWGKNQFPATLLPHDCLKNSTQCTKCTKKHCYLSFCKSMYVCMYVLLLSLLLFKEIKYKYINNYKSTMYPKLGRLIDILI